jgi:hypothetical protein
LDSGYFITKWDLSKMGVTGLSVHAGLRYTGMSYPESTATTAGEYKIIIPSYYVAEAGVAYSWDQRLFGAKFTQIVGVSVDNLLNRAYIDVGDNPGDSRGYYFHYTIKH